MKKIILNFCCSSNDANLYKFISHIRIGISNAEMCIAIMHMNEDVLAFSVLEVA